MSYSNQITHITPETPHDAIGEAIVSDAITRARGRHQPYCVRDEPKTEYFVSNLSPSYPRNDEENLAIEAGGYGPDDESDFVSETRPNNISLEFKPADSESPLEHVEVEFDIYVPSAPTYEEYIELRNKSIRVAAIAHRRATLHEQKLDDNVDIDETEFETDVEVSMNAPTPADALADIDSIGVDDIVGNIYAMDEPFFRRITIDEKLSIDITNPDVASDTVTEQLRAAVNAALDAAIADDEFVVTTGGQYVELDDESDPDFDYTELSETDHARVISEFPTPAANENALNYLPKFEVNVREFGDEPEVVLRLANQLQPAKYDENGKVKTDDDGDIVRYSGPQEPLLFNPRISVEDTFRKYDFDLLPEDYRFEQFIWAKGQNCSTTERELGDEADPARRIETTPTPTSPVYEFSFTTEYDTEFAKLAGDVPGVETLDVLTDIKDGMNKYYNDWRGDWRDEHVSTYGEGSKEVDEYDQAIEAFDAEREEFRQAVKLLEEHPEVLEAFQQMNRVNHRLHVEMTSEGEGFDGWRLFQLVFIVKNLPSIVARDPNPDYEQFADTYRDERAEVLWFPTGGGKTEAYLGLVVFNLFFDRSRGKDNGVTAWIRFPLRLLSRQQKQRFMDALLVAEEYRQMPEAEGGLGGAGVPFSLGYFPGSRDSPNDIGMRDNAIQTYTDAMNGDESSRRRFEDDCKHLDECPLCGSNVRVEYVPRLNSAFHRCTGDCFLHEDDTETIFDPKENESEAGILPFYVTDHDIYRFTPSVLLGSLDKVAVMGLNPLFANLFGNFTSQCPEHGLGYSDRCPEKHVCDVAVEDLERVKPGTRDPDRREEEYFDPIPTLHLVDEVHLLNETLGTMASHYESAYLTLCKKLSEETNDEGETTIEGVTPKVLTSTATIEKYERQIEMLFQKDAARFPEEGPELMGTFYGELNEQRIEREYRGMTPNRKSHLYAVLDFVKHYHELVRDYYDIEPNDLVEKVVRGFHERNPNARPALDPSNPNDLDTLITEARQDPGVDDNGGWAHGFDAAERDNVLDKYETSLLYFTNIAEKDNYRQNISQVEDEMHDDGYDAEIHSAQLTGDARDDTTLPRLERADKFKKAPFEERIDTVPATSFVGHGIDVDRFNFMLFHGYPSQTFQYIQSSSRVGRKDGVPGFVMDVFRPFDKRDQHRYKYFEKLHEYLNRTVEPVAIDRWAKFAAQKTLPGLMKAILLQYYRPMLFRKGDEPNDLGDYTSVNVQSAKHLYEVMTDDAKYPQLTKEGWREMLKDAYVVQKQPYYLSYIPNNGDGFYTNEYYKDAIYEYVEDMWFDWKNSLVEEMNTPEFPDNKGPMRSLRHIEDSVEIRSFTDYTPVIGALEDG